MARALRLRPELTVSVILMGTMKNYALAGGILLTLFSSRSAIPSSVTLVLSILQFVWLSLRRRSASETEARISRSPEHGAGSSRHTSESAD